MLSGEFPRLFGCCDLLATFVVVGIVGRPPASIGRPGDRDLLRDFELLGGLLVGSNIIEGSGNSSKSYVSINWFE